MDDHEHKADPALTPLGTEPGAPIRSREGDVIHTSPELAVGEADVRSAEAGEFVRGSSLWRDAWRRLRKNKLAVFGLIVVALLTIAAIAGPPIIKATTGFTYDYIPRDVNLLKSFPPFKGANGGFSWTHPMGTDNSGRDLLARVLLGAQSAAMAEDVGYASVAALSRAFTRLMRVRPTSYRNQASARLSCRVR